MMHLQVNSVTVAITLVMPPLLRQILQMSPILLIYHSEILEAAHRHRLTVHRPAMQEQQLIRIQQPTACLFRFVRNHVNSVQSITSALRHKLLTNAYSPSSVCTFRLDPKGSRRFRHS